MCTMTKYHRKMFFFFHFHISLVKSTHDEDLYIKFEETARELWPMKCFTFPFCCSCNWNLSSVWLHWVFSFTIEWFSPNWNPDFVLLHISNMWTNCILTRIHKSKYNQFPAWLLFSIHKSCYRRIDSKYSKLHSKYY